MAAVPLKMYSAATSASVSHGEVPQEPVTRDLTTPPDTDEISIHSSAQIIEVAKLKKQARLYRKTHQHKQYVWFTDRSESVGTLD